MDPVEAGVTWMLGILGGGFVAVLAQRLASRDARAIARESFDQARTQQEAERAATKLDALTALEEELRANVFVLRARTSDQEGYRAAAESGTGMARLSTSAYETARAIGFGLTGGDLAIAYMAADTYNASVEAFRSAPEGGLPLRHPAGRIKAVEVLRSFEGALGSLKSSGLREQLEAVLKR